jgi:Zn-dependent peptidase ImmA (M78 family)
MNKYIELTAYELLEELDITSVPIDPFVIAEKMGIKVSQEIDTDKLSYDGEIYLNQTTHKPEIWINPTDSANRQKFTMAHEIGHLVYDVLPDINNFIPIKDNYKTLRRDGTQNIMERRANDFAAKLLMPKELIVEIGQDLIETENIKTKEGITTRLAQKFKVSQEAMKWRLINLGLI